MPRAFNPLSFFRHIPNPLLERFFSSVPAFAGFDWSSVTEGQMEPVLERYDAMSAAERDRAFRIFLKIESLASSFGTQVLIGAARDKGLDIAGAISGVASAHGRAFWCHMEHPGVFESARTLAHIDDLPKQSWEVFKNIPRRSIEITPEMLGRLSQRISEYFWKTQWRGGHCRVEHRLRDGDVDLFFAYPADYPAENFGYDDRGEFEHGRKWNPAFDVVFRYHRLDGTTDVFSQGGRKVREILAQIFARVVLGVDREPEPWSATACFDLEIFKKPSITFPTNPADNIGPVRVQSIRLQFHGRAGGQITFRIDGRRQGGNVYDIIADKLSEPHGQLANATVLAVALQTRVRTPECKDRSITLNLVAPSSCDLDDSPEQQVLRRYLKVWGIEKDADDLATAA